MEYYVHTYLGSTVKLENEKAIKQLDKIEKFKVGQEIEIELSHIIHVYVKEIAEDKVTIKVFLKSGKERFKC